MCVNLKLYKVLMQLIKKKNANPPKNSEFSPPAKKMLSSIILVKALLYLSHVYKGTNQDTYGVSDWESSSKIKLPFVTSHRPDSLADL